LERGGAGATSLTSEGDEVVRMEPTSLNGGEGLMVELTCKVGSVEGEGKGEVVVVRWWRNERTQL